MPTLDGTCYCNLVFAVSFCLYVRTLSDKHYNFLFNVRLLSHIAHNNFTSSCYKTTILVLPFPEKLSASRS